MLDTIVCLSMTHTILVDDVDALASLVDDVDDSYDSVLVEVVGFELT